jgi:hypothetical protein
MTGCDQVQVQRFRYVLHPWTAKYSHWMWHFSHSVLSKCCNSSANRNISHLAFCGLTHQRANILANGA